ncbi:MAG: 2,3-bisphosphoglycerate-independent phosphoglycerate mutase [Acidobacteria bacterium]|nr:2,3-bisphosphoglycerate-independent phosphoglycerate mutase [Acidobacteriota bacterium]
MPEDRPFLILIVLDGFGCRHEKEFNAIAQARTPAFDALYANDAWTTVAASGIAVGVSEGQMGNSEVGHLNIGAGRVVDQDVVRISKAAESGELASNEVLTAELSRLTAGSGNLHLAGLLSPGGVHSLQRHLEALIDAACRRDWKADGPRVFVHAILDGRDTPPRSADRYLTTLLETLEKHPMARLATVVGRYYSMDRDKRWERTRVGYDLMTLGSGTRTSDPVGTVRKNYEEGMTDEFMTPIVVVDSADRSAPVIADGDTIVFFNFRSDRMRQIVTAFTDPSFHGFERTKLPDVRVVTMNRYHEDWDFAALFPPEAVEDHLGQVLSRNRLRQLRIAETEKYAHVTFFFNGGSDTASPGEERILVDSPKVATYDLQPEMSLPRLTDRVIEEIQSGRHDVIVMNIANPDMVGHTGVMEATIEAIEHTDAAVGRILGAVDARGGIAVITADHGNAEMMFDPETGQPHTAHTTSRVPLIVHGMKCQLRDGGALSNVAPTILEILRLPRPAAMTSESLLEAAP